MLPKKPSRPSSRSASPAHRIDVAVDSRYRRRADAALLRDSVLAALAARGLRAPRSVSLLVTDTRMVRRLHRRYLGSDEPTDVLAFETAIPRLRDPQGVAELGAIVIALPVAARGARARGVALADELALLTVHGVLHLLGCDHETPEQDAAMRALERRALARVGRASAVRAPLP